MRVMMGRHSVKQHRYSITFQRQSVVITYLPAVIASRRCQGHSSGHEAGLAAQTFTQRAGQLRNIAMSKLKTSIIAIVTAAAVALGAVAPAAAMTQQEKNALALILGAVAAGVVVDKVINDRNDDKRRKQQNADPYGYDDNYYYEDHRWPGDRMKKRNQRVIPAECVFQIRHDDRRRDVVSPRCLNDFGLGRGLPQDCAFDARIRGDRRTVYGANCLERKGFRIGRYR